MNLNNRNNRQRSHHRRKAQSLVLLAALTFNMLHCPMLTYAAGSENHVLCAEKTQESARAEAADFSGQEQLEGGTEQLEGCTEQLNGYTEQLEDLLIQYADLDAQSTRLIVEGTGLPALQEACRVEKGDNYTILQFETAEEASAAEKQLKQAGYQVFYDEKIQTVYDELPGYTDHLCKSAALMNTDDLTAITVPETASAVVVGVLDSGVNAGIMAERVLTGYNAYAAAESEESAQEENAADAETPEETAVDVETPEENAQEENAADADSETSSDSDYSQTEDNKNHGTKVASVILDLTSDNVSVLPVKVTDDSGSSTVLSVELGIMYAAEHCDVINMSLSYFGTDAYQKDFWNTSIDYAISKGIPVVVSAGNVGKDTKYNYPSCYEPCFTIGALADEDTIASFSCHGTVDFVAPGKNVKCIDNQGNEVSCNGTSFSAPAISALIAELITVIQKDGDGGYTVEELHEMIRNMCTDLGDTGYDAYYGYGLPAAPHAFLTEAYQWTEEPEGCELTLSCVNHPEKMVQYEGSISKETVNPPGCETPGTGEENAEFTVEDTWGTGRHIYQTSRTCEIPALGHEWETVTVEPSQGKDGQILTQCKNCGMVKESITIPAVSGTSTKQVRVILTPVKTTRRLKALCRRMKLNIPGKVQMTFTGKYLKISVMSKKGYQVKKIKISKLAGIKANQTLTFRITG